MAENKPVTTRAVVHGLPVLLAFLLVCSVFGYWYFTDKTSDRFTGTQGAVLHSAIESIRSDVNDMAKLQTEAWARIECRQIIFIAANNRATKDFEKLLEKCED